MTDIRTYSLLLQESAEEAGSVLCLGLDPIIEHLPREFIEEDAAGHLSCGSLEEFYFIFFEALVKRGLRPAACKPNIGFFHALDRPRENRFPGTRALAAVLDMAEDFFPGTPLILDSKRADIQRSSMNYAWEAFDSWQCDAVTVSPYMGSDSLQPFFREGKGVYVLNRTSNPGSRDLQDLVCADYPLYRRVADLIVKWNDAYSGVGAVVGATFPRELGELAAGFAPHGVPLLIPGVGSQGGSGTDTLHVLRESGYDLRLARINSSSGLTHPWKGSGAPDNWLEVLIDAFESLNREVALE